MPKTFLQRIHCDRYVKLLRSNKKARIRLYITVGLGCFLIHHITHLVIFHEGGSLLLVAVFEHIISLEG